MTRLHFSLLFSVLVVHALTQAPVITWQRCLGGSGTDTPKAVKATQDGGIIVAGLSNSTDGDVSCNDSVDAWIIKLDSTGEISWENCISGVSYQPDSGDDIVECSDGGFLMVGYTASSAGEVINVPNCSQCFWLVRLSSSGEILWQRKHGSFGVHHPHAVINTADDGFLVVGGANFAQNPSIGVDVYVIKVDAAGNLEWSSNYGGSHVPGVGFYGDIANSVLEVPNGYIILGETLTNDGDVSGNHGDFDYWAIKIAFDGELLWQKCYGGSLKDIGKIIAPLNDGTFVLGGFTQSSDGDVSTNNGADGVSDVWIVNIDSNGNILWEKSFGGSGEDELSGMRPMPDGGVLISAHSNSLDGDVSSNIGLEDLWLIKLGMNGEVQWQQSYGGTDRDLYFKLDVLNGDYVVAGSVRSTDFDVSGNHGASDTWVVKFASTVGIAEPCFPKFQMAPNPSTGQVRLALLSADRGFISIVDPLGRRTFSTTFAGRTHQLDLSDHAKGIYIVTIQTEQGISSQRLILE